jgi:hypothetical protein
MSQDFQIILLRKHAEMEFAMPQLEKHALLVLETAEHALYAEMQSAMAEKTAQHVLLTAEHALYAGMEAAIMERLAQHALLTAEPVQAATAEAMAEAAAEELFRTIQFRTVQIFLSQ